MRQYRSAAAGFTAPCGEILVAGNVELPIRVGNCVCSIASKCSGRLGDRSRVSEVFNERPTPPSSDL